MSGKDDLELSHDELLIDRDIPLTDAEVDKLLLLPTECPPGANDRVQALFADKVLGSVYPNPIRNIDDEWQFGTWIKHVRESARLSPRIIAAALNKDESFVERLEAGDILPWTLSPHAGASLARLFRIHINAIKQLVKHTYSATNAASNSHLGLSSSTELSETILLWQNALQDELRHLNAIHLLQ